MVEIIGVAKIIGGFTLLIWIAIELMNVLDPERNRTMEMVTEHTQAPRVSTLIAITIVLIGGISIMAWLVWSGNFSVMAVWAGAINTVIATIFMIGFMVNHHGASMKHSIGKRWLVFAPLILFTQQWALTWLRSHFDIIVFLTAVTTTTGLLTICLLLWFNNLTSAILMEPYAINSPRNTKPGRIDQYWLVFRKRWRDLRWFRGAVITLVVLLSISTLGWSIIIGP